MKYYVFLPLLMLTACTSTPKPSTVPSRPPVSLPRAESVRFPEVLRAYHVGRYVDPHRPDLLHEQHPIFRVEAQSRWNFVPSESPQLQPLDAPNLNSPLNATTSPLPVNDAIIAEVNRQKAITERVMREATQLGRTYEELQRLIKDLAHVATNHTTINRRLQQAERRVAELEAEWRKATSVATNLPPASFAGPSETRSP